MTIDEALNRLSRSKFRSSFVLRGTLREKTIIEGSDKVREFAYKIVKERLSPAKPKNDGRQTPMRGHAVFLAQHATATCCRGCLNRWWHVPTNVPLSEIQCEKIVNLIMAWIEHQLQ